MEIFKDSLQDDARIARRWVEDVVRDAGRKKVKKLTKEKTEATQNVKDDTEGKTFLEHLIASSDGKSAMNLFSLFLYLFFVATSIAF